MMFTDVMMLPKEVVLGNAGARGVPRKECMKLPSESPVWLRLGALYGVAGGLDIAC